MLIKDETEIVNLESPKPWSPLILQEKLEDLKIYSHQVLFQFPKRERFILCAEIEKEINNLIHNTIRMEKKMYKKTTLQDIDIGVEYVKVLIRQSYQLKYISTKRFEIWIKKLVEIGRIVGGLIKKFA